MSPQAQQFRISEEQASKKALHNTITSFAMTYFTIALLIFPRRFSKQPLFEVEFTTGTLVVALALMLPLLLFPFIRKRVQRETLILNKVGISSSAWFDNISVKWSENVQVLEIENFSKTYLGRERVFASHDDTAFVVVKEQNPKSVKSIIYYPEWQNLDVNTLRNYFTEQKIPITKIKASQWVVENRIKDSNDMGKQAGFCAYAGVTAFFLAILFIVSPVDNYFTLDFGADFNRIWWLILPVWVISFLWVRVKKYLELVMNYAIVSLFFSASMIVLLVIALLFVTPYFGKSTVLVFEHSNTERRHMQGWVNDNHPSFEFFCNKDIVEETRKLTVYQLLGVSRINKQLMCPEDKW